jgi:hypothetical protein
MVLTQNQEDQWNRIKDPDINPCNYSHLIFDKGAQNTPRRKEASSTNFAGKTGYLHVED